MENEVSVGMNRTGAQMAPKRSADTALFAEERLGKANERLGRGEGNGGEFAEVHREYIQEADRVGSVPLPATAKGAAKSVTAALKGNKQSMLIDKLGERLAFERSGTRLYEALIIKCSALADGDSPMDRGELESIRNDEESHFQLLSETLRKLGADPTAVTPSADVAGVAASGWLQVIADPRTTLAQALNTILSAELTDNAAWELLIELARASDQDELAERFQSAADAEARHLANVHTWLRELVLEEAT